MTDAPLTHPQARDLCTIINRHRRRGTPALAAVTRTADGAYIVTINGPAPCRLMSWHAAVLWMKDQGFFPKGPAHAH